jgi:hypothetical protein
MGEPNAELDVTASEAQGTAKSAVPLDVVDKRQVKSLRFYLLELNFGDLRPGPHTLTIAVRDRAGAQANETTTAFTVK